MPSAQEKLIKILRLEKRNGYNNKAVIGGLKAYAPNWAQEARREAVRPEQISLIDELLQVMDLYDTSEAAQERETLALYMFNRLTRRVPPDPRYVSLPEPNEAAPSKEPEAKAETAPEADAPQNPKSERPPSKFKQPGPPRSESARPPRREAQAETTQTTSSRRPAPRDPNEPPLPKPRRHTRRRLSAQEIINQWEALNVPLTYVAGVGKKMAEKLNQIGPHTVGELLYLFPRRYDDYTQMVTLNKLEPNREYTIVGTVTSVFERQTKVSLLIVGITDETANLNIHFFNQPWLRHQLKEGMQLVFSGKTGLYLGRLTMSNPTWEPVDQRSLHTGGIVPIYPLTKGLSARAMRKIMDTVVQDWAHRVPEFVPEAVLDRADMVDLSWALQQVHFPERSEYLRYARERLAFNELLLLQLGVLRNRVEWQAFPAPPLVCSDDWLDAFKESLPFDLTSAQVRAVEMIREDLSQDIPMNRLLQGDVGSGKTIVATFALACAVLNDKQAAIMAPTSILAEQHHKKVIEFFRHAPGLENARVALLTGSIPKAERNYIYSGLASGVIDVVVGTQAIIQEGLEFHNLGVAVIDEQHRFGVQQRGTLRGKGSNPHILVMTATPIPRTLALTMFADLDLTVLDELPPGRTPIQTRVIPPTDRLRVYEHIEKHVLAKGHQVYVIFPLVEATENISADSALEGYEIISEKIYPKRRVGLIHGRMSGREKEAIMEAFHRHDIDVLVSTTVIEVGVDVPNATAIVIENADRFGLAQLHQLRGRVGRGTEKSFCYMIAEDLENTRLLAMEETTDGFKLAEIDWEQRGPGDLLGVRQSGSGIVRLAEQMNPFLVELGQQEARTIYADDLGLELPEHQQLKYLTNLAHQDENTDLS